MSDDPKLVEQVARAVCSHYHTEIYAGEDRMVEDEWQDWTGEAAAAIAAVRAYDEANMARADEPDTHDISPPVTGWEQF